MVEPTQTGEVNRERLNEVVDELQGTCKSLNEVLTDQEECDVAFLEAMDQEIFRCEGCGWWCGIDEMTCAPVDPPEQCTDCEPDDEEE